MLPHTKPLLRLSEAIGLDSKVKTLNLIFAKLFSLHTITLPLSTSYTVKSLIRLMVYLLLLMEDSFTKYFTKVHYSSPANQPILMFVCFLLPTYSIQHILSFCMAALSFQKPMSITMWYSGLSFSK